MKKALIAGITGKDGSCPAEFLLAKEQLGWVPETSLDNLLAMMAEEELALARR